MTITEKSKLLCDKLESWARKWNYVIKEYNNLIKIRKPDDYISYDIKFFKDGGKIVFTNHGDVYCVSELESYITELSELLVIFNEIDNQ
jgi:hypothetical protein